MKHLFIPYELALIAKEKGYSEICFGEYLNNKLLFIYPHKPSLWEKYKQKKIAAPLYQQIIDWFEQKGIEITTTSWIKRETKSEITWFFSVGKLGKPSKYNCDDNETKYIALNKAIEEAFKLI